MVDIKNRLALTAFALEQLIRLSSSDYIHNSDDEKKFMFSLALLKGGKIEDYLRSTGSIGLLSTKNDVIKVVAEYIEKNLDKIDKKYSSRGEVFFRSFLWQEIGQVADAINWEGKYEVVAEYLLGVARKIYGWK